MALGKSFLITERANVQFPVEAFNVANHPNFATINTALGSTTFGRATTANDPRILQGTLRFSF